MPEWWEAFKAFLSSTDEELQGQLVSAGSSIYNAFEDVRKQAKSTINKMVPEPVASAVGRAGDRLSKVVESEKVKLGMEFAIPAAAALRPLGVAGAHSFQLVRKARPFGHAELEGSNLFREPGNLLGSLDKSLTESHGFAKDEVIKKLAQTDLLAPVSDVRLADSAVETLLRVKDKLGLSTRRSVGHGGEGFGMRYDAPGSLKAKLPKYKDEEALASLYEGILEGGGTKIEATLTETERFELFDFIEEMSRAIGIENPIRPIARPY